MVNGYTVRVLYVLYNIFLQESKLEKSVIKKNHKEEKNTLTGLYSTRFCVDGILWGYLGGSEVNKLPAMQEMGV